MCVGTYMCEEIVVVVSCGRDRGDMGDFAPEITYFSLLI